MGATYEAVCRNCNEEFSFDEGGGFSFHLLRCDRCGETKIMPRNEVEESSKTGPSTEPIQYEQYLRKMECDAGRCDCGGYFAFDAKPRCPRCRSTELDIRGPTVLYD